MEKKEYAWCDHMDVFTFFRPGGSTALRIGSGDGLVMWWVTSEVCQICCLSCYKAESEKIKTVQ
jgi:hypothetical protein